VAFGQAHAETERVQLASVERLYEEEVTAAAELLLWQVPEVEEKVKQRKKLLLDYDAHLRKYETLSKTITDLQENPEKKGKGGKLSFARRKSETELAEDLTQRKVKLEQAEERVDEGTQWLIERFEEMEEKKQSGAILEAPISALIACQLHFMQESAKRLEALKSMFEGVESFCITLQRYDKEPAKPQALDVEGVANITNLNATMRRRNTKTKGKGQAFGLPLSETTSTPPVVCDSIAFLRHAGLNTEGLFRIPGDKDTVDAIRSKYDRGAKGYLGEADMETSVHDVATLLKQWIRELPEAVIPSDSYEGLMELVRNDMKLENPLTVQDLVTLVASFPKEHKELLGFLARFFKEISEFAEENKMSVANLATCLTPSMMRAPEDVPAHQVLKDMEAAIVAVTVFIENSERLPKPTDRQVEQNTFVTFK